MFTGLIETVAAIRQISNEKLIVALPIGYGDDIQIGESIAINGCCLTAVTSGPLVEFDLSEETIQRTAFAEAHPDDRVNVERAMKLGDRFGGHIVQGHVDVTGTLVSVTKQPASHVYRFAVPAEFDRYLINKGSVAIDGISLTVVDPDRGEFDTWIIPHTIENTNLGRLFPGDRVNVEFDAIAKHLEKLAQVTSR